MNFLFHRDGMSINGKSIIGVMTLAAEEGAELILSFNGEDEEQACKEILALFRKRI